MRLSLLLRVPGNRDVTADIAAARASMDPGDQLVLIGHGGAPRDIAALKRHGAAAVFLDGRHADGIGLTLGLGVASGDGVLALEPGVVLDRAALTSARAALARADAVVPATGPALYARAALAGMTFAEVPADRALACLTLALRRASARIRPGRPLAKATPPAPIRAPEIAPWFAALGGAEGLDQFCAHVAGDLGALEGPALWSYGRAAAAYLGPLQDRLDREAVAASGAETEIGYLAHGAVGEMMLARDLRRDQARKAGKPAKPAKVPDWGAKLAKVQARLAKRAEAARRGM